MARCLRSTNVPLAVFTRARSCISCSMPQAPAAGAAATNKSPSSSARRLAPEIIEVEPVVGGQPAVVLQPAGVAAQQQVDRRGALAPARLARLGEPLDVDVIAVAAAVEAEYQRHRPVQHDGDADR